MNDIRQKAESILSEKSRELDHYSPDDMQRLIHELQVHQIELELQNQELRITQGELENSNQRYSDLYDYAPVGYLTMDNEGLITQANITYAEMVAIERASLLTQSLLDYIMYDDRDVYHVNNQKMFNTQKPQSYELSIQRADGTSFYAHLDCVPVINDNEQIECTRITITDITPRKRAEDQLKSVLEDKVTLLRELYHRTKNNMAVISSMLALQADQLDNEQMRHILHSMEYRIRSMALIHQHLYQTDNLSKIDLYEYTHTLTQLLIENYTVTPGQVSVVFDLDHVFVFIDTAIPCGLILNELISNALKHGFPEERQGEICIRLHRLESGEIELLVADNGIGIPQQIDVKNTQTFGLQSLFLLGELQLHGTVECDFNNGFTCRLRFRDTFYMDRI